jgi:hypothetical protein
LEIMQRIIRTAFRAACVAAFAQGALAGPAIAQPDAALSAQAGEAVTAEEDLTLRVNDMVVRPGGVAAAVVRPYASRGVGSGQMGVRVNQRAAESPLAFTFMGAEVFNPEDNVRERLTPGQNRATLRFTAPLPTINSVDGPLAVIYFRVSGVTPDDEYDVALNNNVLIGADGEPIPIEPRSGRLRVIEQNDPFEIATGAEDTVPGDVALLSIQTHELKRLASGTLALRYDPTIAAGLPTIRVDERHGSVTYDTDGSSPETGLVVMHFESPARDFNRVPGDVLEVMVPTRADIPPGTTSVVRPVQSLTNVADAQGRVLQLEFESETLNFVAP